MDALLRELCFGIRRLRHDKLLTITAVLSLAVGIGANTAIFTVTRAVLFQPQPGIAAPDRLVDIGRTQDGVGFNPVSYPDFLDVRSRATRLASVYAYTMFPQAMTLVPGEGRALDRIFATTVSASYFGALGVVPAAGRLLQPGDGEGLSATPVMVISDAVWARDFNRRPDIAGRAVILNGKPFTVAGVTPPGFHGTGLRRGEAWVLIGGVTSSETATMLSVREASWLMLGARLRPGVTIEEANAEVTVLGRTVPSNASVPTQSLRATTASPVAGGAGQVGGFMTVLVVIVGMVLAVACANVAGMLLSRAPGRRREMALRTAIGASRGRIVRQLLAETLVVFGAGAVAGVAVAAGLTRVILAWLPALPFPIDLNLPIDARVIAFTALITLAALLAGLVPALQASKVDLSTAMKADRQGPSRMRLRRAFVVGQVAASLVLVIVGGLFLRALQHSGAGDPGFDPRGVDLVTLELTHDRSDAAAGVPVLHTLLDRVRTIPGIATTTAAFSFPGGFEEFRLGDLAVPGRTEALTGEWNIVEPGFFSTIRMPLIAGRDFTSRDRAGAQPVVIVGEGVARRLWPSRPVTSAIGERVEVHEFRPDGRFEVAPLTIVGISRDPAYGTLIDGATDVHIYVPFAQRPMSRMMIVVRTTDGGSAANEIRAAIASLRPDLTIAATQRAEEYSTLRLMPQRMGASVTASLGAIGVLLAAVGIYGVTAYAVVRRTREIGIRLALGSPLPAIARMILGEGMSLIGLGAVIGLAIGLGAAQLVAGYLAGLPPVDPITFGSALALFVAIGLAACAFPVRRALSIAPTEALRQE